MTKGELLKFLTKEAMKFRERPNFISVNKHLTGIDENNMPSKEQIDGVLVAFINSVGISQGIDYALSFKDFEKRYKPGQLITIGKHTYRIRKAPKGVYVCGACRKANGRIICNMSDYKPYSCAKYTHYSCYLQLIK